MPEALPRYSYVWVPVSGFTGCGTNLEPGRSWSCTPHADSCQAGNGIRCARPGTTEYAEAPPIVITMTLSDFARLPVNPLTPHAVPVDGRLPVNMVNVLHAEPEVQLLSTELFDTPVAVRATPVSFHWDLGDGNTITTTNPGKPYPSEAVSRRGPVYEDEDPCIPERSADTKGSQGPDACHREI